MTVEDVLMLDFIEGSTQVILMDGTKEIASSSWYVEDIQQHANRQVKQFKWMDDDKVIIDLKEDSKS